MPSGADGSVALCIPISRFESVRKALANLVPKEPRSDDRGPEQDKCDDAYPNACHALIKCVDPNGARRGADSAHADDRTEDRYALGPVSPI